MSPTLAGAVDLDTLAEPPRAHVAEADYLATGELVFRAPAGCYASIPAWRSRAAWMGAAKLHPELATACRSWKVKPATFLTILRELGESGDRDTGREIAISHKSVGAKVGVCPKTVQRSVRVAESLDLLVVVLRGCDMTMDQRIAVIGHYTRGTPSSRWRTLPNYYAATMPGCVASLITRPLRPVSGRAVDNTVASRPWNLGDVHLPGGSRVRFLASDSLGRRTFTTDCGRPAPQLQDEQPGRTVAALPTAKTRLQEQGKPLRTLAPELRAYAEAVRSLFPGYRRLSLHRICPGLSSYLRARVSPSMLQAGLETYLAVTGTSWITQWEPMHESEQARYLIGMLKRARMAGYIKVLT